MWSVECFSRVSSSSRTSAAVPRPTFQITRVTGTQAIPPDQSHRDPGDTPRPGVLRAVPLGMFLRTMCMAASHRVGVSCDSPCVFTMPPPQTLDSGDRVRSPQRVSHGLQLLTRLPDRGPCLSVQRHFCVFAVSFPGQDALITIYNTILAQHLSYRSTPMVIQRLSNHLVTAALGKPRPPPPQPAGETHRFMSWQVFPFPPTHTPR